MAIPCSTKLVDSLGDNSDHLRAVSLNAADLPSEYLPKASITRDEHITLQNITHTSADTYTCKQQIAK